MKIFKSIIAGAIALFVAFIGFSVVIKVIGAAISLLMNVVMIIILIIIAIPIYFVIKKRFL
jgi:hypothetical protein